MESHGGCREKLYKSWSCMKQRCYNKNNDQYHNYGGRGIRICDEWIKSYSAFREWALQNGYKEGLTIDRINVNGDYCPKNCRWATSKEQGNNKRDTKKITFNGQTHSISEWADIIGVKYSTLFYRIFKKKWDIERALTEKTKSGELITCNGKTKSIREWAKIIGVDRTTIYARMRRCGMTGEEAVSIIAGKSLELVDKLEETERGDNGFGSSGK